MITIKRLGEQDIELAANLLKCWEVNENKSNPLYVDHTTIKERLDNPNFHVLVAMDKGNVLGGLTAYSLPMFTRNETELFLYEIETAENHRRKGIASKLIAAMKDLCAELRIKTVFLCTDMDNEGAQELYVKTGGLQETVALYTYNIKNDNH